MAFATPFFYPAQTTTVRTVKALRGSLKGWNIGNVDNAFAYVQCFDTQDAVTLGTTVPTFVLCIPPIMAANVLVNDGITLAHGLKIACTSTATGSAAPTTGLDVSLFVE
jgi:hypothetical protein